MRSHSRLDWLVCLALLVAFALRMIVVVHNLDAALAPDEREYTRRAVSVATNLGEDRAVFRPPLYPYAIALVYRGIGQERFVVNTLQALLDTLSVALIYVLAKRWIGRGAVAALAAFVFALSPQSIGLAGTFLSEPLFICLTLGGMVLVTRAAHGRHLVAALGAGVLLALAALTREVVAYFALLVIPVWWLVFVAQPRRIRLGSIALFVVGLLVIFTPWVIRNYAIADRLVLISTSGEYNFARDSVRVNLILKDGGSREDVTEAAQTVVKDATRAEPPDRQAVKLFQMGLDAIRQTGSLYWIGYKAIVVGGFWSIRRFERENLGVDALPGWLEPTATFLIRAFFLALIVFGTFGMIAAPNNSFKLLVGLFLVYSLVLFILTHYQLRYRYPLHVLITPYAAYGIWAIGRLVRTRRFDSQWVTVPRLILALVTLGCFFPLMD